MEPRTPTTDFAIEFCNPYPVVDQASPRYSPYYRGLCMDIGSLSTKSLESIRPSDNLVRFQLGPKEMRVGKQEAMPRQYLGVRQLRTGQYVAEIERPRYGLLWLGIYDTAEEAARICDEAAHALIGTETRTNFPSQTKQKPVANIQFSSSLPADIIPGKSLPSDNVKSFFGSSSLNYQDGSCSLDRKLTPFSTVNPGEVSFTRDLVLAVQRRLKILKELKESDHHNCTHDQMIAYEAWKEHIDQLKKSRLDNFSVKMMNKTTLALGGQAVAAVMTTALTSTGSSSVHIVESAIVLGLSFTLAGISLRGRRRVLSILMTKIGALATASAIVISLGSHLPPVIGWIVGPVAFLVMAMAVILA